MNKLRRWFPIDVVPLIVFKVAVAACIVLSLHVARVNHSHDKEIYRAIAECKRYDGTTIIMQYTKDGNMIYRVTRYCRGRWENAADCASDFGVNTNYLSGYRKEAD